MNNEQQQIIDEAYENYSMEYAKDNSIGTFLPIARVDGKHTYRKIDEERFIGLCIYDETFSEKWGLKIEERELSLNERILIAETNTEIIPGFDSHFDTDEDVHKVLDTWNIPTKLTTITYKEQIIESYD